MISEPSQEDTVSVRTLPASSAEAKTADLIRPLLFWSLFLLLNLLLFLPAYLLDRADSSLLPPLAAGSWRMWTRQALDWRSNLDPFRLSAELTILIGLWALLPRPKRLRFPFHLLFVSFYLLALLYAIYESLSLSFYREDPVFFLQARLVTDGLPFLLRHLSLSPALALLVIGAAITAVVWLSARLPREKTVAALGPLSQAVLLAFMIFALASLFFNGRALASPKSVVSCFTCKLEGNIAASMAAAQRVQTINQLSLEQVYDYSQYGLLSRPDIYLIFVESYGATLYRQGLRGPYKTLLAELEGDLSEAGWQASTILSESPTWGGGSWMAYTSALFGLRVDTHPAYLALLDRFANGGYPHLGRTLQEMGYQYARVTSISVELDEEEWQEYKAFFGPDRWLRYSDLNYSGRHYGWGPAPPDQFVLSAANEQLKASGEPLFLVMITQNSHYPWREVPELVDDWRALNDGSDANPERRLRLPEVTADRYDFLHAIRYELQFLTRFILNEADEDALFILVGDHQPGYITRRAEGLETPLHIISKDRDLIESLDAYGFMRGLDVDDLQAGMKHEGFYSLLMRVLLDRYGRGDRLPPPYLPDGASPDM